MDITFLGQAGLFIETAHGTVLCDPFFNPAFFGSWFPFPSNDHVDVAKIARPDYLFISHLHKDHFDEAFLRDHVSKDTTVLLPEFKIDLLEQALRNLGFHKFIHTKSGETFSSGVLGRGGLRMMVMAMPTPADGPLGDSALCVDDGETRLCNQNDSRPIDIDTLNAFGSFDVHLLQFSGAIWYPMVYRYEAEEKRQVGAKKRANEMARALKYAKQIGAKYVVPSAGPAAFLDDELFALNDFDNDPSNTFPDQRAFIEYMRAQGDDRGRLMIPGTVMRVANGACELAQPFDDGEMERIFTNKREYLLEYKARKQPMLDAMKASWPRGQVAILPTLKDWFEPLLAVADLTCVGVNSRVLLDCTDEKVVVDFQSRRVYAHAGEECDYRFYIDRALVEWNILAREEDWVNTIFLSCRFEAERKGPFNEYVYGFFKCLSKERIALAEAYYAQKAPTQQQLMEIDGHVIQRRCPHLKVDLAKFGTVEDGVLTCSLHGWQFDLASGRCLTSDGYRLYSRALEEKQPRRRRGLPVTHEEDTREVAAHPPCIEVHEEATKKRASG